ncbi:MAG TPA: ATP-binding protein [Gemmatimonadaceae bacterium]|nr:ATP-binding protein [Gemmatimonadaceae bacterium]
MRLTPRSSDPALKAILDPRRLLRWVFIGRLCLAVAIFIAAVSNWSSVDSSMTLAASLAFVLSAIVTVVSVGYVEIYRKRLTPAFLYGQAICDLLLVTTVVHLTNGTSSPFSALYILVIATASLLVPASGGLLVAALGIVMYFADVVLFLRTPLDEPGVWLQLIVIALVALGIRYLSARVRESGEGKDLLVAALQQTRLQAEDILHNIRSGIVTVDVDGRLMFANPMSEHLLGINLIEHMGEPILDSIATVAPELSNAVRRAVEAKVRTTRGEAIVSNVAKRFPVGVTTTYTEHDDDGASRTATAIFQDISDQKRIDALRLRAERLEGIAELSASLAHEIKNPLASIRSASEQIARMPAVSDDQRTLTTLVMRESDRLSRLLSEFLDFARVRKAKTQPVDLATIARGAAGLAAAHPDRDASVRITCLVPEGEPVRIDGDEDLLHRAVFNLALNALQASPPESEVRIEVARGSLDPLPVGAAFDDDAVSLRVSDAGPGIPAEIRDRMFDPFFTTKTNGSGLGLAVVHRAIEAHRGLVFVDSGVRGTRFTVILPRSQRIAERTPERTAERTARSA